MEKLLSVLVAGILALMTAIPASADGVLSADEQAYGDEYGAGAICVVLAAYPTSGGVLGVVMGVQHDGWAEDSAVDIVNYAVATYCHEYWDLLVRTGELYRNNGPLKRAV